MCIVERFFSWLKIRMAGTGLTSNSLIEVLIAFQVLSVSMCLCVWRWQNFVHVLVAAP